MTKGRLYEAEQLLLPAHKALARSLAGLPADVSVPPLSQHQTQPLERLVRLYEARGDAAAAATLRADLEQATNE